MKRLNQVINDFSSALKSLKEAVKEAETDLEIDGAIQRFEFTFELCWKTIKRFLELEGLICKSPRGCLKEAYQLRLIKEEKIWLNMIEDRNNSTHVYDKITSREIFGRIKKFYTKEFKTLLSNIEKF